MKKKIILNKIKTFAVRFGLDDNSKKIIYDSIQIIIV